MADIATIWDAANSRGDWSMPSAAYAFARDAAGNPIVGADGRAVALAPDGSMPGAGLAADRDLETAVLISLFTDATAGPDDLPGVIDADPRGWWGDPAIGSRLWLRMRSKQTEQTPLLVKADIAGALAWLIEDGVAAAIDVAAEWISRGVLGCRITVRRIDGTNVALAYEWAWKDR